MPLEQLVSKDQTVHLAHSGSSLVGQYVTDVVKGVYGTSRNNVLEVNTPRKVATMLEYIPIEPVGKWVFLIDYQKVKSQRKNILKAIKQNQGTSIFLIQTSRYGDFKRLKEEIPSVNSMYLANLRYTDTKWILRNTGIPKNILSFIAYSYGNQPEDILTLAVDIATGNAEAPQTRSDVIKLLGNAAGTVTQLAIKIISDVPKSDKSRRILLRNRLSAGKELISNYGVRTFRNYLGAAFKDILDVKVLYLNDAIYNRVIDLPDGFDEDRLRRYTRHLDEIKELSVERILWYNRLIEETGPWTEETDYQDFLFRAYLGGT